MSILKTMIFYRKIIGFSTSIIGQFTLVAFLASALLVFNVIVGGNEVLKAALIENVKTSIVQTSQLLNFTVATHASNNDLNTVQAFLDEMVEGDSKNGLTYVVVGDSNGKILLTTQAFDSSLPIPFVSGDIEKVALEGAIHIRNSLLLPKAEVGFLQYGLSTKNIIEVTADTREKSLIRTGLIMVLTFLAIVFIGKRIVHRLQQMIIASQEIVAGNYELHIKVSGRDELSVMSDHFNKVVDAVQTKITEITQLNQSLEVRVQQRTHELETSKTQIEESLKQLQEAQKQLITSEKLAGLGSLVAGVAHELNTPIGNSVTVSSTINHLAMELKRESDEGKLRRSNLNHFIARVEEAADLLDKNLGRASELITSFKNVAVDQTSELRREFQLRKIMEELAVTLRPKLRKVNIQLVIDVPPDIIMDSYPGPLTQVIANLFNNALIHAFEDITDGQVTWYASIDEKDPAYVKMQFSDTGKGIDPQIIGRIFDPFFTTKFGQGGSGLGLNICHNIVEGVLEGKISVSSTLKVGTTFIIRIPIRATFKSTDTESLH